MPPLSPLHSLTNTLVATLAKLKFAPPVTHVYNPLEYARASWNLYIDKFGVPAATGREILLLGMNPGPFGMAQTGVPFGEIQHIRDWMGVEAPVGQPPQEHPKRPVQGFACPRSEVSGARLWGWAKKRYGTPEKFFARYFVLNYCPLVFMGESGKNITPDQLPAVEREPLFRACDEALLGAVHAFQPKYCIGVGGFAEACFERVLDGKGIKTQIGKILHPSPASPHANKDWAGAAERGFEAQGVELG